MYLLILQLFKIEYKEDVLLAMTSCGIKKGSTFEGQNLDQVLGRDFPLFTGLIKSESETSRYALLITSVVESRNRAHELVALLKEADIDIENEAICRLILIQADTVIDHEHQWEKPE